MLPSDPGYVPKATDETVLSCSLYQALLSINTDPYAPHSFDRGLIQMVEEFAFFGGES
jgi:predicted secreted acid phosphatase